MSEMTECSNASAKQCSADLGQWLERYETRYQETRHEMVSGAGEAWMLSVVPE